MTSVADTLAERGTRYGRFDEHSACTQSIKRCFGSHFGWHRLADDQKEALEMIAHKIGRILCGDPNYSDSWHDIAGYAKLVDDRLAGVDSNRKSVSADTIDLPAVKTWQAIPVNEFDVPILVVPNDDQQTLKYGGTD